MKVSAIVIFLAIVLSVYTLVNWYLYVKTSALFAGTSYLALILKLVFWVIVFAYPAGRILERVIDIGPTHFLVKLGSFWLGAMLYLILAFLFIDLLRTINHYIPFASFLDFKGNPDSKLMVIKSVYYFVALVLLAAFINARIPRTNHFDLQIGKSFGKAEKLRIVAVSDVHLGTLISKNRLNHLVEKINKQNPDIVLFVGDVFDEDIAPVVNNGLGNYFQDIKSKFGVFAVPGNHEYFGSVEQKFKYLEQHGVKVLRDSTLLIDSLFYVVGRDDRQSVHFNGKPRKSVNDLVTGVDKAKPIVLLDHQPFNLNEAVENGVDLQLSGHTHNGQLWPFNYITKAIFELSSGYKKIGNTNIIVSNGYGTWGPPMRLGSRPEILVIDLKP